MPTIKFHGFAGADPAELAIKVYNGQIATKTADGKPGVPYEIRGLTAGESIDVPLEVAEYLEDTYKTAGPHKRPAFEVVAAKRQAPEPSKK